MYYVTVTVVFWLNIDNLMLQFIFVSTKNPDILTLLTEVYLVHTLLTKGSNGSILMCHD